MTLRLLPISQDTFLTMCRAAWGFCVIVAFSALSYHIGYWSAELDEQGRNVVINCPSYDSIRVHRVDWQTRTNVYVRTIPSTCGAPDAIQPGYYGE